MVTRKFFLALLAVGALNLISVSTDQGDCFGLSEHPTCSPACANLQNITARVQSNMTIYLCPERVEINSAITLENYSDVAFLGDSIKKTLLICTHSEAGIAFVNMKNLTIKHLKIEKCGSKHSSTTQLFGSGKTLLLSSAVYILNCSNFKLESVHISYSDGLGIVLYDTTGVVDVSNSVFQNNSLEKTDLSGGGGVYVEFTICTPGVYCTDFDAPERNVTASNNVYFFTNCTFQSNTARFHGPKYFQYTRKVRRQDNIGLGRGGGLSIQLNGRAEYNIFTIENCTFIQNEADWGGGLYIVIQDSSSHNTIYLNNIMVDDNKSKNNSGGGGVDLGFNIATTSNNTVSFKGCSFKRNFAMFGGGVRIYSSRTNESMQLLNIIKFLDCEWINNTARFGSAIDIAPHVWEILSNGLLPVPLFHNCLFRSNNAHSFSLSPLTPALSVTRIGRGAMMLTKSKAAFSGQIVFVANSGSAVFLSSSIIDVKPQTTCNFTCNHGFEGGAIAFVGFSALFVNESSHFYFTKNKAARIGGALFAYNIDKHNYVSSRSCFIQYHGSTEKGKNVTFQFKDNLAGNEFDNQTNCYGSGYSIFSASLQPCIEACKNDTWNNNENAAHHPIDAFECIGDFEFSDSSDIYCHVSTSGGRFDVSQFNQSKTSLEMYPGRGTELNISMYNDFNKSISASYFATLESSNITQPYSYISNGRMRLYGTPNSTGVLKLQKLGYRKIALEIKVALLDCPPGYILDNYWLNIDSQVIKHCVCSTLQTDTSFIPITECNNTAFRACLQHGYWIGTYGSGNELEYALCPNGYCANILHKTSILPERKRLLDEQICGEYRTGRLCGQCRLNYSVHYHGINYQCGTNDSCKYGWILYIISELLPLTVLFAIATIFNISFTSGAVNGFIWFAQTVHSFPITGESFITFPDPVFYIYTVTRMIYSFFNFDFFRHDKLSFCLWEGATTMDILVFKFVTVVYAIFLVILTVLLLKRCSIFRRCKCVAFSTVKSSIIHGLSSVLVIVFSQCATICCQTLEIAYTFKKGNNHLSTVVFLQGDLTPFSGGHIKYAIPAIFCMIILVIPITLLLIYPLIFKFLKIVRCSDSNPVAKCLCHTPYSKLRPFLDSFQSCFKDDCRLFAGLYFIYRALIISTILLPTLEQKYAALDGFLLVFFLIHAITQPYRKHLHNIIDCFIFFNLLVINKISAYNYSYNKSPTENTNLLPFITTLTVILLSVPLICMILYIAARVVKATVPKYFAKTTKERPNDDLNDFELSGRNEETDSEDSCEYKNFSLMKSY